MKILRALAIVIGVTMFWTPLVGGSERLSLSDLELGYLAMYRVNEYRSLLGFDTLVELDDACEVAEARLRVVQFDFSHDGLSDNLDLVSDMRSSLKF